jgi:amino acid transporter
MAPEAFEPGAERPLGDDERRLAELGYKQELERSWGGFTNMAISISVISILAGGFTTYGQAWNNGGPVGISWGWPIIGGLILIISLCMAEVASAYPTAGGLYYWASRMGGASWGWFTGWFNLIGLTVGAASVDYACATFLSVLISLFTDSWKGTLNEVFLLFVIIMAIHVIINLFPAHVLRYWNDSSAYWHFFGPAIVVGILIFGPSTHNSVSFVFTHTVNNSGFSHGLFWIYVVPLGFLLTQYTITGYDASAHLAEETGKAAKSAAQGVWRSVASCWILGYIMLLAFTFAAHDLGYMNNVNGQNPYGAGSAIAVFASSLGIVAFKTIMIITVVGQFFCGGSVITAASRMMYAFSRDGAVPGHRLWAKVAGNRAPVNASLAIATVGVIVTLPALYGNAAHIPVAFLALSAATTLSLYIAYVTPVFLRWRMGDAFQPGPWTLGRHYKWMAPIAVIEVIVVCIYFMLPFSPLGIPGHEGFAWNNGAVNYAPVMMLVFAGGAALWWVFSAHRWFTGPRRTIDAPPTRVGESPAAGD